MCVETPAEIFIGWLIGICVSLYCYFESIYLKKPILRIAGFGIMIYWPIGLFVYLIWSRKNQSIKPIFFCILLYLALYYLPYVIIYDLLDTNLCLASQQ